MCAPEGEWGWEKCQTPKAGRGGEFYTPCSVVRTLVEILEPTEGRVYDVAGDYGTLLTRLELTDYSDDSETERVEAFPEWRHHYNHHRGHTSLKGQLPAARVPNLSGQNS